MKGELLTPKITKEKIFSIITEYDVYKLYFGDFIPNRVICNHLRGDKNPSFVIGTKSGNWKHFDYGSEYWRGDAIDLVMQINGCDYITSLEIINRDFNLGIDSGNDVTKSEKVKWKQNTDEYTSITPIIQVVTRKLNKKELAYWGEYNTSEEELKEADIFGISKMWHNRKKVDSGGLITFGYWYEELQKWKIYKPYAPKRNKNTPVSMWKWNSAVDYKYCDNLQNLQKCKFAYLTKSRKDRIILSRILGTKCVADIQSESPYCITENTINKFKENSEYQISIMDNDEVGKKTSWWLTREHGFKHANVPDEFLSQSITDFSDLDKLKGDNFVYEYFKNKELI